MAFGLVALVVAAASGADAFRLEAPLTTICDEVDTLRFIVPVDKNCNLNDCKFYQRFFDFVC